MRKRMDLGSPLSKIVARARRARNTKLVFVFVSLVAIRQLDRFGPMLSERDISETIGRVKILILERILTHTNLTWHRANEAVNSLVISAQQCAGYIIDQDYCDFSAKTVLTETIYGIMFLMEPTLFARFAKHRELMLN